MWVDRRVEAQRREYRREGGRRGDRMADGEAGGRGDAEFVFAHLGVLAAAGDEEEQVAGRQVGGVEIDARAATQRRHLPAVEQVRVVRLGQLLDARRERIDHAAEHRGHGDGFRAQVLIQQVQLVRLRPVQRHRGPGDAAAAHAGQQVQLVQQAERRELAHHAEMEGGRAEAAA
ncbi:hypothetical protein D9M71_355410 [compost metagenome]